jgi:hypothetical protein
MISDAAGAEGLRHTCENALVEEQMKWLRQSTTIGDCF